MSYSMITAAILMSGFAQASEADRAYDFRGAYLGMRLADFRALPFPDTPDGIPRLICTGDPLPASRSTVMFWDFMPNRLSEGTGVTSCAWFKSMTGGGSTSWHRTNLLAGGYPTEGQVFEFTTADEGGEPLLYSISMQLRPDGKQAVIAGLRSKFGSPRSDGDISSGQRLDLTHWVDGDQEITLSDTVMLRLSYTLRPLAEVVGQRKQSMFGPSSSGL